MSTARFRITRAAERDLTEIGSYTLERWGAPQCRRYLESLDKRFADLARNPEAGRRSDEIRPGYWRAQQGSHVILYRVGKGDVVEIIRVLHQRMLPDLHL